MFSFQDVTSTTPKAGPGVLFKIRLINESALKFNESALKNLLLNLTNLPLKI